MAIRMASTLMIKNLKAQADQADVIISNLKQQISLLRTATALTAGKEEEQKLRAENDALRMEIEKVKLDLVVAEIRNGVRQVPVPFQRNQTLQCKENAATSSQQPTAETQPKAANAESQPKKAKKEIGQKGNEDKAKPAKEDKGKGKKTADAGASAGEGDKVDVSRLDFRIGKIVSVKKHPDADTLYVETVDLGEEQPRTIVSGLVNHIPIEQMQDRVAVFMCNLKASKMRGISSEGMIMCAKTGADKVEILVPPSGVIPGDRITFDGYPGTPDKQLNPKKKVWETLKPDIRTNAERVATYKGVPFKVEGKGIVVAPTLADAEIS